MLKIYKTLSYFIISISLALPCYAEERIVFNEPAQKERFHSIIAELRCLVCQNQSLADSDADLAIDLRNEVYNMIVEGSNDEQIYDFMVARYGDFVLYNPPIKPSTVFLWFGPFILVIAGLIILFRQLKYKQNKTFNIDANDKARLKSLLNSNEQTDE